MKTGLLKFHYSENIGDNIQSLAVKQHLKNVDFYIDRDRLNEYKGEACVVVMNGWFSHRPQNWPPSEAITPLFFGFHIDRDTAKAYAEHISYFKRFEPIGCRDAGTAEIIKEWGVHTYVSGCATMTFPHREKEPSKGLDMLIDFSAMNFQWRDRSRFWWGTHAIPDFDNSLKDVYAAQLLKFYREHAKTVITSRIHCAMPCAAMGIPVAYCGPEEYRTDVVKTINIPTIPERKMGNLKFKNIRFSHTDNVYKQKLINQDLRTRISEAGVELSDPAIF